jgi:MFS family permease
VADIPEDPLLRRLTRAFRHRNYRLFFSGQFISLTGTWVTRIATSWLVYRLTGSELLLGINAFASQIPLLILTPLGGVLADRWSRHRILVVTQVLSAIQSLALGVLTLTGNITVLQIILLQLFQGMVNSFDTPARQAFVVDMVEAREDLPNAIALNSAMFNSSRIIGPSVGGILIAAIGEGWCFLADAVSYVAVIASLLAMRLRPPGTARMPLPLLQELRDGLAYAIGFPPARALLTNVALVSILGMPYATLMPVFASRILQGGPGTLGLLMTASATGALAGTAWLAARRSILGLGSVIVAATAGVGAGLIIFSASRALWLSLLVLPVVGAGMMLQSASANTILQTVVDEHLRGRVMALYAMAVLGAQPLGSLTAGYLAEKLGAPLTLSIGATGCIAGALWLASRRKALAAHMTPVYSRLGILPRLDPVVLEQTR